jgi:hypothetical protein
MKVWPAKDPDEILKYSYDFGPDLAAGETLNAGGTTFDVVTAAGTTILLEETDGTEFRATISGGIDGEEAQYVLRVTTSSGEVLEDTLGLPIVATTTLMPVPHAGDYTPPTAANLVAVFPEFSSVSPSIITYYLNRAARSVDTSWTQGDFAHARMLLAAHLMTLGGIGATAEAASVRDGSGQFKGMAIGSLRLERFDLAKSSASTFSTTRYGREFRSLLRCNRGGPRVTGASGLAGWGDGDKAWGC